MHKIENLKFQNDVRYRIVRNMDSEQWMLNINLQKSSQLLKKSYLQTKRIECTSYLVLEWESIRRYDI